MSFAVAVRPASAFSLKKPFFSSRVRARASLVVSLGTATFTLSSLATAEEAAEEAVPEAAEDAVEEEPPGSCSSCSSGNFQKITTSNHSFVPSLFAYYNVQRPARHSSVLRAFDGCMKKAPVLDLEPTLRQGREHNTLPWYHLGLPHPCGHSLNAAAALLLTAGRCNGRIPLRT